jgi:sarcosine oxidase subunit gamma
MSEAVGRFEPVANKQFVADGVTLALAPAAPRFSLRGAASDLSRVTPVPLPTRIGDVAEQGGALAVMLGPDEWLLIGEVGSDSAGAPIGIVEVNDRQIGIDVGGSLAAKLLMSGCPLDLERIAVGRGTRTIYETVEIIVIKRAPDAFRVEVWCSFAPWLWQALVEAARIAKPVTA